MSGLRILYHHRIASKDGQYVHIEEIVQSLRKLGAEIEVVAPKMAEAQDFGGELGFVAKLKSTLPKAVYELIELSYAFWDFLKLVRAIQRFKPCVIYERYNILFPSGIWAKKLFNLPLILEINAPLFDERGKYNGFGLPGLARWSEHYVWRCADLTLPVTQVLATRVERAKVKKEKIHVIHNGVNLEEFTEQVEKQEIPGVNNQHLVVGFVGFCREWHKLDDIIRLIARDESKRLFFVIVGDGPVVPCLKALVKELACEECVYFSGLVSRKDMPRWLKAIDIALQPAVVPYASPLKMIEYLAMGKAIVAPAQDNICELLTHEENALLFPEEDHQALLDSILRLSKDDELRKTISGNARQTIQRLDLIWDENANKIIQYASDLNGSSKKEASQL